MEKDKEKESKTEETKVPEEKTPSAKTKIIKAPEGSESSFEHSEDLDLVEKYTDGPEATMGAAAGMHDDTKVSTVRKFKNLSKSISQHTHEVIYDPKKKKSAKKSDKGESEQK